MSDEKKYEVQRVIKCRVCKGAGNVRVKAVGFSGPSWDIVCSHCMGAGEVRERFDLKTALKDLGIHVPRTP